MTTNRAVLQTNAAGITVPVPGDAIDIPLHTNAMVADIEKNIICRIFDSVADALAKWPAPPEGAIASIGLPGKGKHISSFHNGKWWPVISSVAEAIPGGGGLRAPGTAIHIGSDPLTVTTTMLTDVHVGMPRTGKERDFFASRDARIDRDLTVVGSHVDLSTGARNSVVNIAKGGTGAKNVEIATGGDSSKTIKIGGHSGPGKTFVEVNGGSTGNLIFGLNGIPAAKPMWATIKINTAAGPGQSGGVGYKLGVATSTRLVKKNITDIDPALVDAMLRVRPVEYNSLDQEDGEPKNFGMIAEEVAEVDPRLAAWGSEVKYIEDEDGDVFPEEVSDKLVPRGINYDEYVAPLIALCQRQEARIVALEARIDALGTVS